MTGDATSLISFTDHLHKSLVPIVVKQAKCEVSAKTTRAAPCSHKDTFHVSNSGFFLLILPEKSFFS